MYSSSLFIFAELDDNEDLHMITFGFSSQVLLCNDSDKTMTDTHTKCKEALTQNEVNYLELFYQFNFIFLVSYQLICIIHSEKNHARTNKIWQMTPLVTEKNSCTLT